MVFSSLRGLGGGRAVGAANAAQVTQPGADDENWVLPTHGSGRNGGETDGDEEGGGLEGEDGGGGDGATIVDSLASLERSNDGGSGGSGGQGGDGAGQGNGYVGNQGGMANAGKVVGFAAVLQQEGWEFREEGTVTAELQWQRVVNGENAKNEAFTERVLGLQEFKAFAFLRSGSPWVQLGHGFGKFFSLYGTVPELDGKVLMFVGDRGWTRDPAVVQPPVQNTWKWATFNVVSDEAAVVAFAQGDQGGGLWQSGGGK